MGGVSCKAVGDLRSRASEVVARCAIHATIDSGEEFVALGKASCAVWGQGKRRSHTAGPCSGSMSVKRGLSERQPPFGRQLATYTRSVPWGSRVRVRGSRKRGLDTWAMTKGKSKRRATGATLSVLWVGVFWSSPLRQRISRRFLGPRRFGKFSRQKQTSPSVDGGL